MEEWKETVSPSEAPAAEAAEGESVRAEENEREKAPAKKGRLRAWWRAHKPTKRRLIQLYVALLYNANIKGFVTGNIYKGATKRLCVPGLNCYSCPGAVMACPLGALQNAFAQSGTRAPYYVIGILLLLGLLLGRTICGFLCPIGLGQELLYKIKTPKLKKSRVTRVFSYLKYVLLVALVVAVPLMYGVFAQTAVPGFCKYVCPAGTLGGAVMLLIHPSNADLYGMLGGLFTWKFAVLVAVMVASVFIFRFFCRFLCPLGAIYGFFNRFALFGVKLDKSKCTDCGLCLNVCKMDIKRVGDHECINCGECIDVCPAKAIRWKGSELILHRNAVEAPAMEEHALAGVLSTANAAPLSAAPLNAAGGNGTVGASEGTLAAAAEAPLPRRRTLFFLRLAAWIAAGALLITALVYYNFFDAEAVVLRTKSYSVEAGSLSGASHISFLVERTDGGETAPAALTGGDGTLDAPYTLGDLAGSYELDTAGGTVYFTCSVSEQTEYRVSCESGDLFFRVYYADAAGERVDVFEYGEDSALLTLSLYGNSVGDECYDFSLPLYDTAGGGETFTLSQARGKVVLINFWATWCGPCVTELPEFERIKEMYGDRVEVVAVHSAYVTEDVQTYLDGKADKYDEQRTWRDWQIRFVLDGGEGMMSETYSLLGGKGSYPMTLVVDADGNVTFTRQGSVTFNMLITEVEKALAATD